MNDIYVYVYVCMRMCVCVYMCKCVYIHTHIYEGRNRQRIRHGLKEEQAEELKCKLQDGKHSVSLVPHP